MAVLYNVQVLLALLVAGLSGLLTVTSAMSALRYKNSKLTLAAAAFAVFLVKGGWLLYQLLIPFVEQSIPLMAMDLVILGLMYVSVAKR